MSCYKIFNDFFCINSPIFTIFYIDIQMKSYIHIISLWKLFWIFEMNRFLSNNHLTLKIDQRIYLVGFCGKLHQRFTILKKIQWHLFPLKFLFLKIFIEIKILLTTKITTYLVNAESREPTLMVQLIAEQQFFVHF